MPGTPTPRYAIPTLSGSDLARDIDTNVNAGLTAIDTKMTGWSTGPFSSRPTSTGGTPGVAGRLYYATDVAKLYLDTGTSWTELRAAPAPASGKSIIATEETTTSTTYTLLTTPDRVSGIVLPTDGLIVVAFQGMIKSSAAASSAAVFLGTNQVQSAADSNSAPVTTVAEGTNSGANKYEAIGSHGGGLVVAEAFAGTYGGDVSTGQLVGVRYSGDVSGGATIPQPVGGPMYIFAAAGTYDVSIRWRAGVASTLSAKNRKLWCWTQTP